MEDDKMGIIEQAKTELGAINFGAEDSAVMIEILEKFLDQWDSGGAVSVAAPVLQRLIAGKPLGPLTGADSEWFDPIGDGRMLQNRRCSTVFKDRRGPDGNLAAEGAELIHDIDAPDPMAPITFPYSPSH
jgi:hypothetical protein